MALSPRIEIRQRQSLVMTPQLRQAIQLLQLSNLDLAEFVAAEVEKNPLLEIAATPAPAPVPIPVGAASGGGEGDAFDTLAAEVSLRHHLQAQIGAMRAAPEAIEAALILADEIEDDGYLRVALAEVAARHRLTAAELRQGLALLQACDPAGVGAQNLPECLGLQLRERNRLDPAMQALLANLALAARGRIPELEQICGVDADDLAEMLAELRTLDPKPGLQFAPSHLMVAVPDVFVMRTAAGALHVELNSDTLPRVLMNNLYAARLGGRDPATKTFIAECTASAGWLVRSLEQRARTILKVATAIAQHQEGFFSEGIGRLRPLTQRALAEQLGVHESTVSRVTAGKYLSCARGNFELRHFFSAAIPGIEGGAAVSAAAVQDRIRQLVEGEAAALSDGRIVAILNGEGIDIARRTVAKYREGMGILSSVERRRLKTAFTRI